MAIQLVITLDDSGNLKVEGIPENRIFAFGMLELAKQSIAAMFAQNDSRQVQPAPPGFVLPKV